MLYDGTGFPYSHFLGKPRIPLNKTRRLFGHKRISNFALERQGDEQIKRVKERERGVVEGKGECLDGKTIEELKSLEGEANGRGFGIHEGRRFNIDLKLKRVRSLGSEGGLIGSGTETTTVGRGGRGLGRHVETWQRSPEFPISDSGLKDSARRKRKSKGGGVGGRRRGHRTTAPRRSR